MPNTTYTGLCNALPKEVLDNIDSFRRRRKYKKKEPDAPVSRQQLYLAQRRVVAVAAKCELVCEVWPIPWPITTQFEDGRWRYEQYITDLFHYFQMEYGI